MKLDRTTLVIAGIMVLIAVSFATCQPSALDSKRSSTALAIDACKNSVKAAAKYPSSVSFDYLSESAMEADRGVLVQLEFESKNGFGNLVPQRARCVIGEGKPFLEITNL